MGRAIIVAMNYMNSSDWNTTAGVEGREQGIPCHRRGYADSVDIESIPGSEGTCELLVTFCAESGYTGAAVRVADIIDAMLDVDRAMVEELLAKRGLQLAPLPEPAAEPQGSGYGLY